MLNLNPHWWRDKTVCVTGGTGFLGWTLVRQLLGLAAHVRVLGLPPRSEPLRASLSQLDCVFTDVRDPGPVRAALRNCQLVFHTAGTVAVWGPALAQMHSIHVDGTRQVLHALPSQARMVHTSSAVAIGASRGRQVLTESSPFQLQGLRIDYVQAKKAAENLALAAVAQGQDVVVVNPTYLLGPDDHEGSVMGRFCLRCWRGKVPLIPPGGFNFVDVRDVARGHLLAAEHGLSGQRYLLGGDNLSMVEFVHALAQVRGRSTRWCCRMPTWLHYLLACYAEVRAHFLGREPYPALQHVRLNNYNWYYDSERARTELGFDSRPLPTTLHDTHEWYCRTGQLKPRGPKTDSSNTATQERQAA